MTGPGGPFPSSVILSPQERALQAEKKMINGTRAGRSKVATPVVAVGTGPRGRSVVIAQANPETFVARFDDYGNNGEYFAWGGSLSGSLRTYAGRGLLIFVALYNNDGTIPGVPVPHHTYVDSWALLDVITATNGVSGGAIYAFRGSDVADGTATLSFTAVRSGSYVGQVQWSAILSAARPAGETVVAATAKATGYAATGFDVAFGAWVDEIRNVRKFMAMLLPDTLALSNLFGPSTPYYGHRAYAISDPPGWGYLDGVSRDVSNVDSTASTLPLTVTQPGVYLWLGVEVVVGLT